MQNSSLKDKIETLPLTNNNFSSQNPHLDQGSYLLREAQEDLSQDLLGFRTASRRSRGSELHEQRIRLFSEGNSPPLNSSLYKSITKFAISRIIHMKRYASRDNKAFRFLYKWAKTIDPLEGGRRNLEDLEKIVRERIVLKTLLKVITEIRNTVSTFFKNEIVLQAQIIEEEKIKQTNKILDKYKTEEYIKEEAMWEKEKNTDMPYKIILEGVREKAKEVISCRGYGRNNLNYSQNYSHVESLEASTKASTEASTEASTKNTKLLKLKEKLQESITPFEKQTFGITVEALKTKKQPSTTKTLFKDNPHYEEITKASRFFNSLKKGFSKLTEEALETISTRLSLSSIKRLVGELMGCEVVKEVVDGCG